MHPIEAKIPHLPARPGVYVMKGGEGEILYVGKAKSLRARVRSYVGSGAESYLKTRVLMRKVQDLEFIITATEKEALLLENTLIKKHRPRYNVELKDDKTFLHILLDRNHPFPRFAPVRRPAPGPGRVLFGPYSSAGAMRDTLRLIHRIYPLRTCKDREFRTRRRPCLQHQMGRCTGACVGEITSEQYNELVDQAVLILQGRSGELIQLLEARMNEAAEDLRFEEAARLRDRIRGIRLTMERQRVVDNKDADRDVIGMCSEAGLVEVVVLMVRGGSLVDRRGYPLTNTVMPLPELLRSFLLLYYSRDERPPPPEVLLPLELEDAGAVSEILGEMRGGACTLRVPKRGEKKQLLDLAEMNARSLLEEHAREDHRRESVLLELEKRLRLGGPPRRIECFDISNIQGRLAVGSCVTFLDGLPHRQGYRRYRVRVSDGADDYGMMYEVLWRRFSKAAGDPERPDLLLVDGGKGHLGVALRVLRDLGIEDVGAAAIAKARRRPAPGEAPGDGEDPSVDRVFLPGRANPVGFPRRSSGLHLLQQVRDEAHRFAVTYHRKLRSRELERSELDGVPGIGPKRKRALLEAMGGMERIRRATVDELASVPGMSRRAAQEVWNRFHPPS